MHPLTSEDLEWIEGVMRRFETTWRDGARLTTEEALAGVPQGAVRDHLLVRVLQMETTLRRERGEVPSQAEYESRFPEIADTIRTLFTKNAASTEIQDSLTQEETSQVAAQPLELPGYEVLETIGKGGMGIVFKARHLGLKMPVAIKVILPGVSSVRFQREARLIAAIDSPCVVRVHDFRCLPDGRSLLIMEYVDGTDLQRVIRESSGALSEGQVTSWMTQVCEGMMAAAELGIIHRDLKPANMLIDRKSRVKVADFGLARSENVLGDMTLTGHVMGTPHYMAPEQAEDPRCVDTRADIYSFGAAFYHALTGVPPFTGESAFSILYKHKTEPLISPRSRNPEISERICSIIERCLAKSPGDRFPSFAEIHGLLARPDDLLSPWEMAENPQLEKVLAQYHGRRRFYLDETDDTRSDDKYHFPSHRILRIVHGDIVDQEVDAIVSSDTYHLSMNYGVSLAIRKAAGRSISEEARHYGYVRPGRAAVTSAGALKARFIFHGVTVGISSNELVLPSRDLISEIMTSCFYHADTLNVRSMAFPLLGTGAMGFSRVICLDTMFQFLARMFLRGLTCVQEARIVLYPET